MLLCWALGLLLVGVAEPAAWIARPSPIPKELAHKEGCYIKEINDVINFGDEVYPAGRCERIACERRYIDYASCGVVDASPACHVVEINTSRDYPECCPYVKCDENNVII